MSKFRSIPEEIIKVKANQIWQKRQREGREGTSESDWNQAKKYLEKQRWEIPYWQLRQVLTKTRSSFWNLSKFRTWTLSTSEGINLLVAALVLSAAGSIITSRLQEEETKNETLNKYFDKIEYLVFKENLLMAQPGSPAWVIAKSRSLTVLRDLDVKRQELVISFLEASNLIKRNNHHEGISLAYLDLPKINLSGLNLQGAELSQTNLEKANLNNTNLERASLNRAKLIEADLKGAKLAKAILRSSNLRSSNLKGANLFGTDLSSSNLSSASLESAFLFGADLSSSNLSSASLEGAFLFDASLSSANFQGTNLFGADLNNVNLIDAQNLTSTQIKSACNWQQAIYKQDRSENQKHIEALKKDKLSNPREPLDCSRWSK